MLWRVAALIMSVVEALLNKETNVQMLMALHNHDCGKVDIDMIMRNTDCSHISPRP